MLSICLSKGDKEEKDSSFDNNDNKEYKNKGKLN